MAGVSLTFNVEIFIPEPSTPTMLARYSKDGTRNWSGWKPRSLGAVGDFMGKPTLRRLGKGEQWVFEVRVTDDVRADLFACGVQVESSP